MLLDGYCNFAECNIEWQWARAKGETKKQFDREMDKRIWLIDLIRWFTPFGISHLISDGPSDYQPSDLIGYNLYNYHTDRNWNDQYLSFKY